MRFPRFIAGLLMLVASPLFAASPQAFIPNLQVRHELTSSTAEALMNVALTSATFTTPLRLSYRGSTPTQEVASGVFNVLNYGALGDGVTLGAQTGIQAAIDAANAFGATLAPAAGTELYVEVVIPAGRYRLNGPITITNPGGSTYNHSLLIRGIGSPVLQVVDGVTSSTTPYVIGATSAANLRGITIENLTIRGNNNVASGNGIFLDQVHGSSPRIALKNVICEQHGGYGLWVRNIPHTYIDGGYYSYNLTGGIWLNGTPQSQVTNVEFVSNTGIGLYSTGYFTGTDQRQDGLVIKGCRFADNSSAGFWQVGGKFCLLQGNTAGNNLDAGFRFTNAASPNQIIGLAIQNNALEGNTPNLLTEAGAGSALRQVVLRNNGFSRTAESIADNALGGIVTLQSINGLITDQNMFEGEGVGAGKNNNYYETSVDNITRGYNDWYQGVSETPNVAAIQQWDSTDRGVLFPRLTSVQLAAISATSHGLMAYDRTIGAMELHDGTAFKPLLRGKGAALVNQIPYHLDQANTSSTAKLIWSGTGLGLGQPPNGGAISPIVDFQIDKYGSNPSLMGRRAQGSASVPTATASEGVLLSLIGRGYGATGFGSANSVAVNLIAQQAWTDSAQGTAIVFRTTPNSSTTAAEAARITGEGQFRLPLTGSNAGVLIGGDTQLYRSAADVLRTPDSFTVDATNTVGVIVVPPASQASLVAANAVPITKSVVEINQTGTVTLTSTPSITTSGATEGQLLTIVNVGTNALTLTDETGATGSKIRARDGASVVINAKTARDFYFDGSEWYER